LIDLFRQPQFAPLKKLETRKGKMVRRFSIFPFCILGARRDAEMPFLLLLEIWFLLCLQGDELFSDMANVAIRNSPA
jgi:hypothetical protein